MTENASPRVQVSCLAFQENKIVMIQKIDKQDSAVFQRFIPPGGHVELHETLEEACIREMREETGLEVSELKLAGVVSFLAHTSSYHSLCFFFITHQVRGNISLNEPEKLLPCWLELSEIEHHPLVPDYHKGIIKHIMDENGFFNAREEWCQPDNRIEWKMIENTTISRLHTCHP